MRGRVKWFSNEKGFGFLTAEDGENVFVHFSALQMEGYKKLDEGEDVEFEITDGAKGRQAASVRPLGARPRDDPPPQPPPSDTPEPPGAAAIGVIDGQLRVVEFNEDGSYHFIDPRNHLHRIGYLVPFLGAAADVVGEFEELVNTPGIPERELQRFFETHPDFILFDEYAKAHPHLFLTRDQREPLIPDFVLEPLGPRNLCDLLEIKLPSARLLVAERNRPRLAAGVLSACAQLREYSSYFDDDRNRARVKERYGLEVFRPRMLLLMGRRPPVSPIDWRKAEADLPSLRIHTYDDILERMKARLRRRWR